MEIIETPIFSKRILDYLTEESYRLLQLSLVINPELGDKIPGAKGLRKLRWISSGVGKRSGIRVIYYWYVNDEKIFMLLPYKKSKKSDLTIQELKILIRYVEDYLL